MTTPAASSWPARNRTAIVGAGYTPMVRQSDRSLGSFAVEAALHAIGDAGLTPEDIDGYIGSPSAPNRSAQHVDGIDEVSSEYVVRALGLKGLGWSMDIRGLPSSAVAAAVQALYAGLCRYVVIVRAMYNPSGGPTGVRYSEIRAAGTTGGEQYTVPYGLGGAGGRHALWVQRYMHDYGAKRESLYAVVGTERAHAQQNPIAFWRGRPLSREDYLNARFIYEPMGLFDIDIPVTGAGALVMTTAERARDLPHRPALVSGIAGNVDSSGGGSSGAGPGDLLFERAGIERKDVGVAMLYDGYSHFVYYWLEQLGFCSRGEAHQFVQDGRITHGGALPLNTFGGSLGEGRLHGFGHLREGALQVMGRAGERQVPGAQHCAVAVGVGIPGNYSALLMLSAQI